MQHTTVKVPLSSITGLKKKPVMLSPQVLGFDALPPLGLYIHWPWCVRKCPYCDFNSHEFSGIDGTKDIDEQTQNLYVQALLLDLQTHLPQVWGRRVYTIFIGGGTPSLMSAHALDTLISGVRALLPLEADAEITLEANPGTVETQRFRDYADIGVNRISIGVQSFNTQALQAIGRIHDRQQAIDAVNTAVQTVSKVNIDIMYGLPGQTLDAVGQDIKQAIDLGVGHISAYHMTLEANTYFHRYPPVLPDDELCDDMHETQLSLLSAAGFAHYETSAYAKPLARCQHNQNYWTFGDYLGIGAGAHGKISFPDRVIRTVKHKHPKAYLDALNNGQFTQSETQVKVQDLPFEFMLNALRLQDGFDVSLFAQRTGLPLSTINHTLSQLQTKGFIQFEDRGQQRFLVPTALGHRFQNDVVTAFLPDQ